MFFKTRLAAAVLLAASTVADAQVLSIGSTKGGAVAQLSNAVSSAVSTKSEYQMRPQAMAGTQQYISGADLGRIEFGISNAMQYYMATSGTGMSEGTAHENLRIVATLTPFVQGVIVAANSDIHSMADLKGKRVPAQYTASPLFRTFWDGFLAGAGLSMNDVVPVPVASLPKSWAAFKQGDLDAVIAAAGSAAVREMDATVSGGIRFISLDENDVLLGWLPKTEIRSVDPATGFNGILAPTNLHAYDTVLFANKDVPENVVYAVAKALVDSEAELKASGPLWKGYQTARIATDHGLNYHPGAMKLYKELDLAK
ncbi:TAXI family TRAP transporter solute-binding subunit [Cognatishimia sp. D5M38]|uniref:TAXI family TRAP transporter solute-binding subunit n=1 Tax=Cognatishimia coralii TaxID=3083254 RepID=A0ABU8QKT4_9RHOB